MMDWATIIMVLGTAIIAVATIALAYLTRHLAQETRRQRELSMTPSLGIYLRPHEAALNILELVIHNTGAVGIENLRLELQPNRGGLPTSYHLGFVESADGTSYLAPGEKLWTTLANGIEIFANGKTAPVFKVVARFEGEHGTKHNKTFAINPNSLSGMTAVTTNQRTMAKAAESIAKDVHSLIGMRKLKVDVFDTEDRARESKVLAERVEKHKTKPAEEESTE